MPEFLSAAWLLELDRAVRDAAAVPVVSALVIEQVVLGVPGRGEVRYRVRIDGTGASVADGSSPERPDIRLTTDYDTAVAIARGRENAQIALASGRLRVGGNVEILVRSAGALATMSDATAVLRGVTTYPSP